MAEVDGGKNRNIALETGGNWGELTGEGECQHKSLGERKIEPASPTIHDIAHEFQEHTYRFPTNCDVCGGLLVGLWSQGLQCKRCGQNVHRGEGANGHDDCQVEALFTTCDRKGFREEQRASLGETITAVRKTAQTSPHFFKDVTEQIDRDLLAHAKQAVVLTGVEEERSKKLRRVKDFVVPLIRSIDKVEAKGEVYAHLILLEIHTLAAGAVVMSGLTVFAFSLSPTHGLFSQSSMRFSYLHAATLLGTFNTIIFVVALALSRLAFTFERKMYILDRFLREVFGIDAERDLGLSVADAALRARAWSRRFTRSAFVTCGAATLLWHGAQLPPLPETSKVSVFNMFLASSVTTLALAFHCAVNYFSGAEKQI